MVNNIKISVIIPVFSLEKYIGRCLKSIINQTLEDIEIIIINDGSSDNSLEIINSYKEEDSRIITYSQENCGVSSARNKGVDLAKGDYITFVDGDDYIEETMLEEMFIQVENQNIDMVFCYLSNDVDNKVGKSIYNLNSTKCLKKLFEGKMSRTACGILFNTDIVKKNGINFKSNLRYGEDFLFTIRYLSKVQTEITIVPKKFYKVEERTDSATRKYDVNRFRQIKILAQTISIELKNSVLLRQLTNDLNYYIGTSIFSSLTNIVLSNETAAIKLNRIRELKKSEQTKRALQIGDLNWSNSKNKAKILLIRYGHVYFIYFFYSLYKFYKKERLAND